jgi:hypothetical protein
MFSCVVLCDLVDNSVHYKHVITISQRFHNNKILITSGEFVEHSRFTIDKIRLSFNFQQTR